MSGTRVSQSWYPLPERDPREPLPARPRAQPASLLVPERRVRRATLVVPELILPESERVPGQPLQGLVRARRALLVEPERVPEQVLLERGPVRDPMVRLREARRLAPAEQMLPGVPEREQEPMSDRCPVPIQHSPRRSQPTRTRTEDVLLGNK
jgi:hypothetical protein